MKEGELKPEEDLLLASMPDEVRELRNDWPSQTESVENLTRELEQEFRFGQQITKTDRGYLMGGTLQGGSSSMWYPATQQQYHAYKRWRNIEGLYESRDDEAYCDLQRLLDKHDIQLATHRTCSPRSRKRSDAFPHPGYGQIYAHMLSILPQLPKAHLSRETLKRIQLGGWGPDAAKASAYKKSEAAVLMYDFAVGGARRTFIGLFLHELGHAHETALSESECNVLHQAYQVLIEEDAFFGVEFLLDPDTRKLYQKFVFVEFLAETYMIYASCGAGLRARIKKLAEPARGAWEQVYASFKESFGGMEYE
ncbi:MAG: hypothetical protein JKY65_16285 [Planctomycetes bacterium]|nr:hypothetical protein [Planctomycetota bacterium]